MSEPVTASFLWLTSESPTADLWESQRSDIHYRKSWVERGKLRSSAAVFQVSSMLETAAPPILIPLVKERKTWFDQLVTNAQRWRWICQHHRPDRPWEIPTRLRLSCGKKDHLAINDTKLHLGDTTQQSRFDFLYFRAKTRNHVRPELRPCGSMYRCPSQRKDINLRKKHKHVWDLFTERQSLGWTRGRSTAAGLV